MPADRPLKRPAMPGAGRPRLPNASRCTVRVMVTLDERRQWQAAADAEVLTLSEWLRAAAELALARGSTR